MSGRSFRVRAALAQNLLASAAPARALVASARIQAGDSVYDLGAGTGLITRELIAAGARVVAVERDANLARKLRDRFEGRNVEVLEADMASVAFVAPFKVVANPPFNLTAALLRRLLFDGPPPVLAALALQREAARKYVGLPRETMVSLLAKPWFDLSVSEPFRRADFVPAPSDDVGLLQIERRPVPALDEAMREPWRAFVRHGWARGKPDAWRTFRDVISNLQWRRLSTNLGVAQSADRASLTYAQWLGVFRFVAESAPIARRRRAFGLRSDAHLAGADDGLRDRAGDAGDPDIARSNHRGLQ